jgi:hypothetical protein
VVNDMLEVMKIILNKKKKERGRQVKEKAVGSSETNIGAYTVTI